MAPPAGCVVLQSGHARHAQRIRSRRLARSADTQQWIATFGRSAYDDQPLFFPVSVR
jgi:hypothetical protein